jgi:carbon monoxide dehydrogenase subunit G
MESSRTPGQTEVLAMKLEQSFEVKAPIDQVWDVLIDLERVAPCLPGAAITDRDDEGTYHGTFQVKLGPTTAAYRGQIKIEGVDEASRTATLKAHGSDKRGQGGANATIVNKLFETDDGTRVEAVTDFTITGRLARFGRGGMIEDISNRLMREFAQCLQAGLTGDSSGATGEAHRAEAAAAAETRTAGSGGTTETAAAAPEAAAAPDPTPAAEPGEGAVSRAEAAPPGMTPDEAAASAAAETRPEDSAAEGKSPAEVGLQPTAAEPGPGPADFESPPGPGQPASVAPPAAAPGDRPAPKPFTPPPAAKPISGIRLFFSVLWERILRLFGRKPK